MKSFLRLFTLSILCLPGHCFSPEISSNQNIKKQFIQSGSFHSPLKNVRAQRTLIIDDQTDHSAQRNRVQSGFTRRLIRASFSTLPFLYSSVVSAASEVDDGLELADLPPVYVPILFAVAILGGVGVLTASLGDVMDEEAALGLQSGARAKKERDRSRSSYFKK